MDYGLKVTLALLCLGVGIACLFAAAMMEDDSPDRPAYLAPQATDQPEEGADAIDVLKWGSVGFIAAGGIWLLFLGIHRSAMLGRPGY